ncbi:periplasmic heavy metal sensor [Salipiger bermudensis]|uniref:periplasmic heavy metal sensor n=1 Tax=Salipiger bermudensis TaxID=344736 RepID=UPI001C99A3E0|nr:periplasmic heavy metal sensor [Salipiger bermudensis]MBY6004603.1 periplasmic heavy metal sensor [Salipiger bermudensis]
MSEDMTTAKTPKMTTGLRVLLFASLAANLAVAGVVAGLFLTRPDIDRDGPPRGRDFVFPYTHALKEEQRRELGRTLRGQVERQRDTPGDFLDEYRTAIEILRAEPFDPAAFAATLDRQGERAENRQAKGQRLLVDYVAQLTPEERAAYAQRLEDRIREVSEKIRKGPRPDRD